MPLGTQVDVRGIAMHDRCSRFSGADLASLLREAAVAALRESMRHGTDSAVSLETRHFDEAFSKVGPSVSYEDEHRFREVHKRLRLRRANIEDSTGSTG